MTEFTDYVRAFLAFDFRNGKDWAEVADPEGQYPVYGSGGAFGHANQYLYDGEAVLFGRKGTLDRPLYVNEKFWTVDTMYYAIPKSGYDGKFLYYWAQTIPFDLISTQTAIPSMTSSDLGRQRVPYLALETQRRIADYLDKEISEMDAMIDEFEGLVRELETRKLLLPDSKINHQGASVPTVPAKLLTRITTGDGDTQDAIEDGEFPFYVRSDTVRTSDEWTFEGPAVLTSGDGAGVGKIFHFAEGKFRAHQRVYVLRSFKGVDPKYFYWCFRKNFPRQVEHGGAKATVESVRMNMVADTPIPLPPLDEQREIANELDREFERMEALIEESTKLIENLKARKTALITEVVTGRKEV